MVVATQQNMNDLTTNFEVLIDGGALDPVMTAAIEEITVDEAMHLPAMATVRWHVNDLDWLKPNSLLSEGKAIAIRVMEHTTPVPLFKGIISGVEPDLSIEMPLVTIRAYDYSYKLHRRHQRKAFLNVTDGDVVRQLASAAGLTAQVDDPGIVHPYLFQNNVSHYEFIRERASLNGYDLYVDGDQLFFKRPHQTQPGPALEYGTSLHRFRPRSTTFEPVTRVTVRGWDPITKREIIGVATQPGGLPEIGQSQTGAAMATQAWGSDKTAEFFVTHLNVAAQNEADRLAQSYLDELGGSHIEAEGLCNGDARIRLLRQIEVKEVGDRFNGKYTVTGVTHTYSNRGHQTSFTASARRSTTIHDLLNGTRPRPDLAAPVIGLVTNINDPERRGRVKVKFPWLADDQESHWARIATPMTGKGRGAHFLPEVDDEVLVAFEHGDINAPYVIGSLWNGKDQPPVPPSLPGGRDDQLLTGGSAVKNRLIKSTKGNMLIFNDSDSAPGVFLVGSSGAYIMVDDEKGKEKIALADKTRKNRIEIRSDDNSIVIENNGDILVTSKGNVKADITGTLDAKVTGNTTIEATGALTIKSSTNVTIEAGASLTLKGSMITIQGSGPVSVSGTPIKLN